MTLSLSYPRPKMELAQAGVKIGDTAIVDDVPVQVALDIAWLIGCIRAQVAILAVASFVEVCGEIWGVVGEPCERWAREKLRNNDPAS